MSPPAPETGREDIGLDALKAAGVLLVTGCYAPVNAAGTARLLRFARWLRAWGWRVQVLTVRNGSETRIDPKLLEVAPGGVRVISVPGLYPLRAASWLKSKLVSAAGRPAGAEPERPDALTDAPPRVGRLRDLRTAIFETPDQDIGWLPAGVLAGAAFSGRHRPAFVLSSGPPHTAHLIAAALRPLLRARWLADLRDPWARLAWKDDPNVGAWTRRLRAREERFVVERADGLILNTPPLLEEFRSAYPTRASRFSCIPNGFDEAPDPLAVTPIGENRPIRLTHAGALYGERHPGPLLRAVANLRRRGWVTPGGIEIVLVGTIDPRFEIPKLVDELGLADCVRLVPWAPHHEAKALLEKSDVLLLIQPRTRLQIPSKLFEYMRMGKPVLALVDPGAAAEVMTRGRLGPQAPPEDLDRVEAAIMELLEPGFVTEPDWEYLSRFAAERLVRQLEDRFVELPGTPR